MTAKDRAFPLGVYLYPGDLRKDLLKVLVEKCAARLGGSVDRRPELNESQGILKIREKKRDENSLLIGSPEGLRKALSEGSVCSAVIILPAGQWGAAVEELCSSPWLRIEGIFRATHLGLMENGETDLDELAQLQSTILRAYRRIFRPRLNEEVLSKSIDWKARIPGDAHSEGPSFFSFFTDPSMKRLLEEVKSAVRDIRMRMGHRLSSCRVLRQEADGFDTRFKFDSLKDVGKEWSDFGPLPSVLLLGETGTGKTLLARWIAGSLFAEKGKPSGGADNVFCRRNISAIPKDLVDTELFGAVSGAYTGSEGDSPGLFLGNRGRVVFLDEIGDMDAGHQTRLLTYMDSGLVSPVGYHGKGIPAPAVIVAATNRPLREWVESGSENFRGDLLNRFDYVIEIPPLRERQGDRKLLISLLLQDGAINPMAEGEEHSVTRISLDAINRLISLDCPGNFRELRYVLRRAVQRAVREGARTLCLRHIV